MTHFAMFLHKPVRAARIRIVDKNPYGLAIGVVTSLLIFASPAVADPYKWCAVYRAGGSNCGFTTIDQCQATVSGVGGFCQPNQFYTGPDKSSAQRSQRQTQRERSVEHRASERRASERRAPEPRKPEAPAAERPVPGDRFQ